MKPQVRSSTLSPVQIGRALLALTLAFFALAASNPAWADPPGRVGRIAEVDGSVWLYDDEQGEWVQARRNRPVTEGDRLSVERGGRAEVQIGSATLRLASGSEAEFSQLDDDRVRVRLHGGSLALRLRGGRDADIARDIAILTPEGRYEPVRAGRYRVDISDNGSSLGAALAGTLRFEARDSQLDIGAGQRAEFWVERGQTHYAWARPTQDRFDEWVAREDREDDRERQRYVSPEMTGSEDLDRHGLWDRHPDYGSIWYPRYVTPGWAPYRYGHWVHLRPWGWTWVDDAPWGFAPFHYGRWVHWHGRWGWVPGTYVARPVYAPALVAWFGGPNLRIGINVGGPTVGWVPLAPREVYYPVYGVSPVYVRNVNSPYHRWHGPDVRYDRHPPSRPIMYTNQGVAGGVTVVPQGVIRNRQPITSGVAIKVEPQAIAAWQPQPAQAVLPAAPTRGAVNAVPAAPGAVRIAPWTPPGQARKGDDDQPRRSHGAAEGDGGEGHRVFKGGRVQREDASPAQAAPRAPTATPVAPTAPVTIAPHGGGERELRRGAPAAAVTTPPAVLQPAPAVQPVQPVPRHQPAQPVRPHQPAQSVRPDQPVQPMQQIAPAVPPQAAPGARPAPAQGVAPTAAPLAGPAAASATTVAAQAAEPRQGREVPHAQRPQRRVDDSDRGERGERGPRRPGEAREQQQVR